MRHTPPDPDDLILGTTSAPYPHPQYRLTPKQQSYHGLLWGATGTGKSKLLQAMVVQMLNKGRGVCLIDPHGDLATDTLSYLVAKGFFEREDAYDRLVYLDFGSGSHVPFNVLAGYGDAHSRALAVLDGLTRTWPDLHNAPLFRTLFLSCALVLIDNHLPLTELNHLLVDEAFRRQCLAATRDPLVRQTFAFFDRQPAGQAGSTLRRLFLLSFSPIARGVLGQTENVLDLRRFMDSGVSLIVNLGTIPDLVTRRLIGAMLMVAVEQAALSRADVPLAARQPWSCLVDEWPSFAAGQGETLEHVLSQTRKYRLTLYLAAQSLAQIDSSRLAGAFENCHLSVTFRMGYESAKKQAEQIAVLDPYKVKSAPRTPSQRPQYQSMSEQREEWAQAITHLATRQAYVKVQGQSPVAITTLNVPTPQVDEGELSGVVATYRRRYQRGGAHLGPFGRQAAPFASESTAMQYDPALMSGEQPPVDFAAFFGEVLPGPEDDEEDQDA